MARIAAVSDMHGNLTFAEATAQTLRTGRYVPVKSS
jgi:hypothetical protein